MLFNAKVCRNENFLLPQNMRSFIFIERLSNTGCTLSISTLCLSLFLSHSFISICYQYAVNFFSSCNFLLPYIIEMKDEVKNMWSDNHSDVSIECQCWYWYYSLLYIADGIFYSRFPRYIIWASVQLSCTYCGCSSIFRPPSTFLSPNRWFTEDKRF